MIDDTPFSVIVRYNLNGMGEFTINMPKRYPENDLSSALACLLKTSRETKLRAMGALEIEEIEKVKEACDVALSYKTMVGRVIFAQESSGTTQTEDITKVSTSIVTWDKGEVDKTDKDSKGRKRCRPPPSLSDVQYTISKIAIYSPEKEENRTIWMQQVAAQSGMERNLIGSIVGVITIGTPFSVLF